MYKVVEKKSEMFIEMELLWAKWDQLWVTGSLLALEKADTHRIITREVKAGLITSNLIKESHGEFKRLLGNAYSGENVCFPELLMHGAVHLQYKQCKQYAATDRWSEKPLLRKATQSVERMTTPSNVVCNKNHYENNCPYVLEAKVLKEDATKRKVQANAHATTSIHAFKTAASSTISTK